MNVLSFFWDRDNRSIVKNILIIIININFINIMKFKVVMFLFLFSFFSVLVWEPIIFFFPLIFLYLMIENKIEKFNLDFIKKISFMIPSILLALYIATNPLSDSEWKIMASV